jgi:hypothetical protein
MAIAFYGEASRPTDNGTYTTSPAVVTPPANMQAGDLVVLTACMATTSGTAAISQAGGQSWTSLTQRNATRNRARNFWCVFNGTWSASPSVTLSAGANNIVRMLVFRPHGGTLSTWAVDVAESSATYAAPTTPFTVTIPQVSTNYNGSLVIAIWTSADDNGWGSLAGGWDTFTQYQVRNTSGTYDQSITGAWKIQETAGVTGSVSMNQALLGGDAGTRSIMAFREIEQHSGAAAVAGEGGVAGVGKKSGLRACVSSAMGAVAAVGIAGMLAASVVSGGGAVTVTGAISGQSIVKVINEVVVSPRENISLVSISGAGSIVATGAKGGLGATLVSGDGTIQATGFSGVSGPASVAGDGSVAASGLKGGARAQVTSGSGAIVASGRKASSVAVDITGGGSGAISSSCSVPGVTAVSGDGTVVASGSKAVSGDAAVAGDGSVSTAGTRAMAIVKVINEQVQPHWPPIVETTVSGAGAVSATGRKSASSVASVSGDGAVEVTGGPPAFQIVKVINETLQPLRSQNILVKVINETIQPVPRNTSGSAASSVSGGGAVVVTGHKVGGIVKVINESVNAVEGSFLTSFDIVQVVNETVNEIESKIKRVGGQAIEAVAVSGGGSCATQGRKGGLGATQVSGDGSVAVDALAHARGVAISGGGNASASVLGAHYVEVAISGGGGVAAVSHVPRQKYDKKFTRVRTGDPKLDRAFQLIEEEFSRMIDFVNRKTG